MDKIIKIQNLRYIIPHTGTILEDLNLEIGPDEFLGVLGHNGAGKSTLLDLLMGFRNTAHGNILVLGEDPNARIRKHKDKVFYMSHDISLKGDITASDFLKFNADYYPNYSLEDEKRLLKVFNINQDHKVGSLSTGQQKKLLFIAGASSRPKLMIIDEVTAVFDPETRELFFNQLQVLRKSHGTAIILATNIVEDLPSFVDKVFFIKDKKGIFHSPDEISKLFKTKLVA